LRVILYFGKNYLKGVTPCSSLSRYPGRWHSSKLVLSPDSRRPDRGRRKDRQSTPLPAKLSFGGRFGAVRIEAQADQKGNFKALLPKAGEWVVHVESEDPPVQHEFPKLQVKPKTGTQRAEIDLRLPDTTLRGRVIDDKGEPIAKAIVTALAYGAIREDEVQPRTDEAGHFEFRGLLPGATLFEADAGQDRFADPVMVSIPEEKDSPSVSSSPGPSSVSRAPWHPASGRWPALASKQLRRACPISASAP
jgi:hypothetical protein